MSHPNSPTTVAGTAVRLGVSAVLWFLLLGVMLFVVPKQKRMFDDFAVALPILTQIVIDVSSWCCDYWWIAVLAFVPTVVLAALVTYYVRHRSDSYVLMAVWTLFLIGMPLAAHFVVGFSLFLVRNKLLEGLSK